MAEAVQGQIILDLNSLWRNKTSDVQRLARRLESQDTLKQLETNILIPYAQTYPDLPQNSNLNGFQSSLVANKSLEALCSGDRRLWALVCAYFYNRLVTMANDSPDMGFFRNEVMKQIPPQQLRRRLHAGLMTLEAQDALCVTRNYKKEGSKASSCPAPPARLPPHNMRVALSLEYATFQREPLKFHINYRHSAEVELQTSITS
ncbi:hypothetical protein J6590_027683 [Homalodisca vitripennis]|nr:hypothetical protein J6590_027683 [Homalodisca vitripennis]